MDHRSEAQRHAEEAERLLATATKPTDIRHAHIATVANAHATLALYHQREADRGA